MEVDVEVGNCWVISQVTPCPIKSLASWTLNGCCSPVGTDAVPGVSETAIPESRLMVAVPVFFVSAAEVAVMVMVNEQLCAPEAQLLPGSLVGSGTELGAVKVTVVLAELAGMFPVLSLQGVAVPVFEVPEESVVVVVKVQAHVTLRLVVPETIEVRVTD